MALRVAPNLRLLSSPMPDLAFDQAAAHARSPDARQAAHTHHPLAC